jgi:hypothetical protein
LDDNEEVAEQTLGAASSWELGHDPLDAGVDDDLRTDPDEVDVPCSVGPVDGGLPAAVADKRLAEANQGTSPQRFADQVGLKRARAAASWRNGLGFETTMAERRFARNTRREPKERSLPCRGVDNAETRALLEDGGFCRVIEAGLGTTAEELLDFQVHTFPSSSHASELWGTLDEPPTQNVEDPAAAHGELSRRESLDEWGPQGIAGISVGSALVGVAVTAMTGTQAIRLLEGRRPRRLAVALASAPRSVRDQHRPHMLSARRVPRRLLRRHLAPPRAPQPSASKYTGAIASVAHAGALP